MERQSEAEYLTALYDVAMALNSTLSLPEVLPRIVETTVKVMGVKASLLRLLSPDKRQLLFGAAYGLSEGYLRKGPVEVAKSGVDREVLARRPVAILDASQDPAWQYPEAAQREGIVAVLSVPLAVREGVLGVLRVYRASRQAFTGGEIHFLSLLANLAALALHNALLFRALEQKYEDLHRNLGELLVSEGIITPA